MDTGAAFDFLDFNFDVQEEKENTQKLPTHGLAIPDFAEEELEWLSNKDAFPSVESCLDILSDPLPPKVLNHHSPVSVLDNINLNNTNNIKNGNNVGVFTLAVRYPMKARSTGIQRKRLSRFPDPPIQHFVLWGQENARRKQLQQQKQKQLQQKRQLQQQQQGADVAVTERKCTHCQVDKTPQWRAGPMGPKTLCNACGVRYKSGRLVPEYRPANSPTFSSTLHSNSHRKVIEMRKQKEMCGEQVDKPCAYNRVA